MEKPQSFEDDDLKKRRWSFAVGTVARNILIELGNNKPTDMQIELFVKSQKPKSRAHLLQAAEIFIEEELQNLEKVCFFWGAEGKDISYFANKIRNQKYKKINEDSLTNFSYLDDILSKDYLT